MSFEPDAEPLADVRQETWFAYMRVMLRLNYEMNRQLQADNDISLQDYDVLNALADSPGTRLQLTSLASRIGLERTRLSHHLGRMAGRGLVARTTSAQDGRGVDAVLTDAGLAVLRAATPGHVALVRQMFFDGLDDDLLDPLHTALEQIHEQVLAHGTLPRPGQWQHRWPELDAGDASAPRSDD